jgi:hypothetical protein
MRSISRVALVVVLALVARIASADVPLGFEINRGQVPPDVRFVSTGHGIALTPASISFSRHGAPLRLEFVRRASPVRITGFEPLPGTANYFIGADPSQWRTGIETFAKVRYENVFRGIDVLCYGREGTFEYDFIVAPRANPADIAFRIDGARRIAVDANGDVVFTVHDAVARLRKPLMYQDDGSGRVLVGGRYRLRARGIIGFDVDPYDRARPLVIDPVLIYSTYLGGTDSDFGNGIAVDHAGNAYVVGQTNSFDFPVVNPAGAHSGNGSVFISKLNATGSALVYSTYLGGRFLDVGTAVAVDSTGNAYVTGYTQSPDFPVVHAIQPAMSNPFQDVFLAKISADGSHLEFSTFFGATGGRPTAIALDPAGNVYLTGIGGMPITTTQFSGNLFLAKFNSAGSVLLFSTQFGGNGGWPGGVATDAGGNVYLTGGTTAPDFPTLGALQSALRGPRDAFVSKLSIDATPSAEFSDAFDTETSGSALANWTIDRGSVDLTSNGTNVAVVLNAATLTSRSTFTLAPARSTTPASDTAVYRLEFSLGGTDSGRGTITVRLGGLYSETFSIAADAPFAHFARDFAVTTPTDVRIVFESAPGNQSVRLDDVALSKIVQVPTLRYSTFLGGTGDDFGAAISAARDGRAIVTGRTSSPDFPALHAAQSTPRGGSEAFVASLDAAGAALVYSTYLGGSLDEEPTAIACDRDGNVYAAGYTVSSDFPVAHAIQPQNHGGYDAYLAKFDPSGAVAYATYFGGSVSELANGVAVDDAGTAVVAGHGASIDFPLVNALQLQPGNSTDTFIVKIVDSASLQIIGVTPSSGGNAGLVTVKVVGSNFPAGSVSAKLIAADRSEVTAANAIVADSTLVVATFDLAHVTPGVYDVQVLFPAAGSATITTAFTVEQGGEPRVWADIIGRNAMRIGVPSTLYLVVGNRGNQDAFGVPVTISGLPPAGVDVAFDLDLGDSVVSLGDERAISLFFPRISPGLPQIIPITVTPRTTTAFNLSVVTHEPFVDVAAPVFGFIRFAANTTGCINAIANVIDGAISLVPGASCTMALASAIRNVGGAMVEDGLHIIAADPHPASLPRALAQSVVTLGLGCVLKESAIGEILEVVSLGVDVLEAGDACGHLIGDAFGPYAFRSAGSIDPNEKRGPAGAGAERYLTTAESLRYAVFFENLATATASARDVVVTDHLDATNIDVATATLGPITIGTKHIEPPFATTEYSTKLDLRPGASLLVGVDVRLDRAHDALEWRFTTLDPSTQQPPADPLAGFLPPGAGGSVVLVASPKTGLPAGATIRNSASITFDANAPMTTPEWRNTVDNSKPLSAVAAIPAPHCNSFDVHWSGSDTGSGIENYTVFVSDNGGPPSPWRIHTQSASATFFGDFGHTYALYSVARDRAGNVEDAPAVADAQVTLADSESPVITLNGASRFVLDPGQAFVDPGATAIDGCAGSVPVTTSGAVIVDVPGTYTIEYRASDPAGNRAMVTRTVVVLTPAGVKNDVLNGLSALPPATKIDEAIKHLRKSIDVALWSDESHPRPNGGESVFNAEKDAVKSLQQAGNGAPITLAVERLARIDRYMAAAAIAAAHSDPKKMEDAVSELTRGDEELAAGRADVAIERYKNAWSKALRAS